MQTPLVRFLALTVALSLALSMAQSFPALNGIVATDSSLVDVAAINEAAQPLQAEGADILILFIESQVGSSLTEAETYLDSALEFYGFRDAATGGYDPDLVSLFIGTAPLANDNDQRPLYIVYGKDRASALEANVGGEPFVDYVQGSVMVPRLVEGDFTGAITAALGEVEARLGSNSPQATPDATASQTSPTAVPVETIPSTQETAAPSRLNRTVWLLAALFGALFLIYLTRRVGKPATSGVDARLKVVKGKLSERLIDLAGSEARPGHDPYLPADPNTQTDMVLLTGLLQDERPDELEDLHDEYRAATERLEKTANAFEDLRAEEERLNRRSPDLEPYIERYETLLADLDPVTAFTERLAGQWQALQSLVADLPQRLKRLRATLTGAKTSVPLTFLGKVVNLDGLFSELESRYESALKNLDGRSLRSLRQVEELEADLEKLTDATGRLTGLERKVDAFTEQLDSWREQGTPPDFGQKNLDEVREQAAIALRLLEEGDFKVVDAQLDEAEERLTAAQEGAEQHMTLFETNSERIADLEQVGEEAKLHIERAALTFDLVDDFAPANWRDIRGNGTEAQKAADAAFDYWQQAQQVNSLEHPSGVSQAAQALDAAEAELRRVHTLTEAIETRLETLRAAQETAQQQLDAVAREVDTHQETLRQPEVERDVSRAPGEKLDEAEQIITEVRSLLAEDRPDWLTALAKIQEADRLADLALAGINEEREAMAQRRRMLASEKTEAESSIKRIVQYVRTHKPDLHAENLARVQQAVDTYRHAQEVEANAKSLSGEALATTLKEATIVFDEAQRLADDSFDLLEADFQRAESLRQETAEAVARTRASFDNLERFVRSSGLSASMHASLNTLAHDLPSYDASSSPEELQASLNKANALEEDIERLHTEARRHAQALQSAQRQERMRQLETARRRRAAQDARQRSTWGSWPETPVPTRVPRRSQSSVRSAPRPMPRASSAPPLKLPKRSSRSARQGGSKSGGGWGGGGRKSGRGW